MSTRRQALCCECGNIRTCERPRNYRMENYWFNSPINNDWHREVGDLKCSECGRVTRHALLHPGADQVRDHAEMLQTIGLGWTHPHFSDERKMEIRRQYHSAFPENPYTDHRWWKSDEIAAREAGKNMFPAMCGAMLSLPKRHKENGRDITEFAAPAQLTDEEMLNHEAFDADTGMWWVVGECVNCLAVRNAWLVNKRREDLRHLFIKMAAFTQNLDPAQVEKIWTVLQEIPCER